MTHSPGAPGTSMSIAGRPARVWIVTLAAALAAGVATWAAGESLMISETGSGSRGGGSPSRRWSSARATG